MNLHIEQILSNLNTISRMAIIENAPSTEKMLISYAKILKYRYQAENTTVIASTEIVLAKTLCEYYKTQMESKVEFIYEEEANNLSILFLPHFSLLSYYYCILSILGNNEDKYPLKIVTKVKSIKNDTNIEIVFVGNTDMSLIYKDAYEYRQDDYASMKQAKTRLEEALPTVDIDFYCDKKQLEIRIKV